MSFLATYHVEPHGALRLTIAASITARPPCFFFQAEDGIRDDLVTGVQTCALPISPGFKQKTFTPQNSLLNTTRKGRQRSGLDEYLKAKERTNQNMSKSQFHIKIPQTCPLCHLHLPLKAPLICLHLRARL